MQDGVRKVRTGAGVAAHYVVTAKGNSPASTMTAPHRNFRTCRTTRRTVRGPISPAAPTPHSALVNSAYPTTMNSRTSTTIRFTKRYERPNTRTGLDGSHRSSCHCAYLAGHSLVARHADNACPRNSSVNLLTGPLPYPAIPLANVEFMWPLAAAARCPGRGPARRCPSAVREPADARAGSPASAP